MASSATRRGSFKVRRSPRKVISKGPSFDVKLFLDSAGVGRKVVRFRRNDIVFAQGDPSKHVTYIQEGSVKLSVVNETGKEAVVAILGPGDFLGEGCIAGQPTCMATATAVASTSVLIIDKNEMIRALHREHEFSDRFISFMLARNIRIEEDLVDQLFNSSEKRLARTLLLLARYGKEDKLQRGSSKSFARDARGNGRYDALPRKFLHEQIPQVRFHQVQRRPANRQLTSECCPARMMQLS